MNSGLARQFVDSLNHNDMITIGDNMDVQVHALHDVLITFRLINDHMQYDKTYPNTDHEVNNIIDDVYNS